MWYNSNLAALEYKKEYYWLISRTQFDNFIPERWESHAKMETFLTSHFYASFNIHVQRIKRELVRNLQNLQTVYNVLY